MDMPAETHAAIIAPYWYRKQNQRNRQGPALVRFERYANPLRVWRGSRRSSDLEYRRGHRQGFFRCSRFDEADKLLAHGKCSARWLAVQGESVNARALSFSSYLTIRRRFSRFTTKACAYPTRLFILSGASLPYPALPFHK